MSATEDLRAEADEEVAKCKPRRTRIDPAHEVTRAGDFPGEAGDPPAGNADAALDPVIAGPAMLEVVEEPSAEMLAAVSGENLEARREQLERQVAELAGYLRERLKEVDRREAQLNARFAQLEGELRASRVWFREREAEFQEREGELRRQVEAFQEREAQRPSLIQRDASEAEARLAELGRREQQLSVYERELEQRQRELERYAAELMERDDRIRQGEFQFANQSQGIDRQAADLAERFQRVADQERDFEERSHQVQRQALELATREQYLGCRERELADCQAQVEEHAAALSDARQRWDEERLKEEVQRLSQQEEIARQQEELARQQEELARQRAEFARQGEELGRQWDEVTRDFHKRSDEREQQLLAGETLIAQHAHELDRERAALRADRQAWELEKTRREQQLEEREQAAENELADQRKRLDARQEWIEQQHTSLEHVRREMLSLHRQSLEMRLIAEQLWSQITGRLTPAEVTHAIAQLRLKLTEQYRLEEQDLQARRSELVQLGERIAEQHRELTQLRAGLREWAAARQAEIENQAQAIVERELKLDDQQDELRRAQEQWSKERRQYERHIRDLNRQLQALPAAA